MATINQDYLGRLTETVSQQIIPSLGVRGAPLQSFSHDFSADGSRSNSYATISTALGVPKGRESYTLNRTRSDTSSPKYNTYTDPSTVSDPANYGEIVDQEFKIYPDMVKEGFQSFSEQELSNLRDPAYIRGPLREQVVETVRRQVWAECLRRIMDPFFYVDAEATTVSGGGTMTLAVNGLNSDYDEFSVNAVSALESQLFDRLIPDTDLSIIATSKLFDGVANASVGGGSLNWLNYAGTLDALKRKQYPMIKNFVIHRVNLVDGNQDIQKDGLPWTNAVSTWSNVKASARPSDVSGHNASYTTPVRPGVDSKEHSSGTIGFADIEDSATLGTTSALASTANIIGVALHKRALGIAAFREFSDTEFAGVNLGGIQTSFFQDPLTGFPFRLMLYYIPQLQKYQLICSAKIGFVQIDPGAATLIFKS